MNKIFLTVCFICFILIQSCSKSTEYYSLQMHRICAIEKALYRYKIDVGYFPSNEYGLSLLINNINNATGWEGPYLNPLAISFNEKGEFLDLWGNPINYFNLGKGNILLESIGSSLDNEDNISCEIDHQKSHGAD